MRQRAVPLSLFQALVGTKIHDASRCAGIPAVKPREELPPNIETMARTWLDHRPYGVLAIALMQRQGEHIGYVTDLHGERRLQDAAAEPCFEIGSITKPMTAAFAAYRVEEGLVTLDTPIGPILEPYLDRAAPSRAVTLGQLVTHASGLPRLDPRLMWRIGLSGAHVDPYRTYSREIPW